MTINFDPEPDDSRQPFQVSVPFLNRAVGAGDAVKRLTQAAGVEPCAPCEERRRKLNERVQFVPMGWA